ncbi:molybdate-anion transporter [Polyodon spathula]|uniref:molybdate-anion transporter n=1 Tax=Polyodon spathula TaxID=7913 RepID=UPI001B7F4BC2|nr:molybdate-anion transporter [Polyodon spathula]
MLLIAYLSFLLLLTLCLGFEFSACRTGPGPGPEAGSAPATNPAFRHFQLRFYRVYFLALWSDWLQAPYLYKLYQHYGFLESQIAVLYVCGLASGVLCGLVAGWLGGRLGGPRRACLLFCACYSACCLTKLSRDYFTLLLGRALGGLSTSLLAPSFEGWYQGQHLERHDFPREWIPGTFRQAATWNHGLAVAAGFAATVLAEWLGLGPVAPFLAAVPCLLLCGALVIHTWEESPEQNGNQNLNRTLLSRSCTDGLSCLLSDRRVLLLGSVEALFESVVYIFVFLWTPVLDPHGAPLGIIFSCLMASSMLGGSLYRAASTRVQPLPLLSLAVLLAFLSLSLLCFSTLPGRESPSQSFLAFLLFEGACGLYFPAMGFLRGRVIPESRRQGVLAWLRVPLLLLACLGLLALHGSGEGLAGPRRMFLGSTGLMLAALLATAGLFTLARHDRELRLETESGAGGQQAGDCS